MILLWVPGEWTALVLLPRQKVEAVFVNKEFLVMTLSRDKFVQQVWDWKDEYADIIHQQWAKMGISGGCTTNVLPLMKD